MYVYVYQFSHSIMSNSVTPWTAACQASLSIKLPELVQIHVHQVGDAIQPSHPVFPFSCLQSFPASGSFQMSELVTSGGQSIGVSASASVLPMNIEGWFPLRLTGLISLQSKRLSSLFLYNSKASVLQTLSLLYGPTLASVHDYWKNHSFD